MSCDFAERSWHYFLENGDDNKEYLIQEELKHVMGYQNSPLASDSARNLPPDADPNIDSLPQGVDDGYSWDFDGAICGKSLQRVGVRSKFLYLQGERQRKKRKVLTIVAETVQLAQDLLRSYDVPLDVVPSSQAQTNQGMDCAELMTELERAISLIAKLVSVKTIYVHRQKKRLDMVKQFHAEKVSV